MEIISKLFGGAAKVKITRLFLFNSGVLYDIDEVTRRAKVKGREARRERDMLEKIGLIKERISIREVVKFKTVSKGRKKHKRKTTRKVKVTGWVLNDNFPYLEALKNLLVNSTLPDNDEIARRFNAAGRIKMLVTSGLFIQNWDSRVDLLIVGDALKFGQIESIVKTLESEIGRELRYSAFETPDFYYRLGIFDKLIRDIIDFPHIKIIDKLGIE